MSRESEHTDEHDGKATAADEPVVEEKEIDMLLGDDDGAEALPAAFAAPPSEVDDAKLAEVKAEAEAEEDGEGEIDIDDDEGAREAVDAEAGEAVDTEAGNAVDTEAGEAVDTEAGEAVDEEAGEDVDEDAYEGDEEDDDAYEDADEDSLEDRAVAAAHEAIFAGETALEQAEEASLLLEHAEAGERSQSWLSRRDKIMAMLLIFNLALLGMMAAVPGVFSGDDTEPTIGRTNGGGENPNYVPKVHKLNDPFPVEDLYEEATLAARRGDYPTATRLLKQLLKESPNMSGVQLRLVYSQLAYSLLRDGKRKEAEEYTDRIDGMRLQTTLPEDLVRAARRAERDGRGSDMRRYFARFLLQQNQIRPDMRDVIAEAYLKIGDSYRLDAEA
ncbi:MAG: tetratricopeptide repeat protein, partial [Planctomycetota bacterium]